MFENIFWVYSGFDIFITLLGPIYMVLDLELRLRKGIFLLRSFSPLFYFGSIVLLLLVSGWMPAVLYVPILLTGAIIASIIRHRGLG